MVNALEEYITEEQRSVVFLCGQNGSIQTIVIKKCFLFKMGSVSPVKPSELGRGT
jgi:hypothetical protein